MCGIAGFLEQMRRSPGMDPGQTASAMSACLASRGPDSGGEWHDESGGVAFGHRRLAILDLTPTGHQPMVSADGRYVITCNGEIYNHPSLREELTALGHAFRGTSDTEVMLAAVSEWGIEMSLARFTGMFAFGLWDRADRTLILARDRMGEKPLYYGWSGTDFLFASELKALRAHPRWRGVIDRDVLALYFRHNYVPAPYSIYKGIRKLIPGTFLRIRGEGAIPGSLPEPIPYWSLREVALDGSREPFEGTDAEAVDRLEAILRSAVSGQMVADVPLGAFLSGGVDSSVIVALMQAQSPKPVKTFTIGFDDVSYDEAEYARSVARHLGTDHTELRVTPREAIATIPRLPTLYDEPFGDSSQIPTCLVSSLARRHVKVSLSGDGGDELFCGYNRHARLDAIWRRIRRVPNPLRKGLAGALSALPASLTEALLRRKKTGVLSDQVQKLAAIISLDDPERMYLRLTSFWEQPDSLVLGASEPLTVLSDRDRWPALPNYLERLLYVEAATSLPDDMLVKVDRASMGVGLEARVPMLDHRLVEFAWSLPLHMKLRDGVGKWILRQVLYRHVPPALIERPKAGFGIPIDVWLTGPLRAWAEDLLNEDRLQREGFLDPAMVRKRWEEHVRGKRKWTPHLWGVLMFQAWRASL